MPRESMPDGVIGRGPVLKNGRGWLWVFLEEKTVVTQKQHNVNRK